MAAAVCAASPAPHLPGRDLEGAAALSPADAGLVLDEPSVENGSAAAAARAEAGACAAPMIRTDGGRGGTGSRTWGSAKVLGRALLASLPAPSAGGQVLELGAGTGELAISLGQAGWRNIVATDGEPAVVRNMKYNVQANKMGHAVRCVRWDWADPAPKGIDLENIDLCVGSDLVYYDREHSALAALLARVLAARSCAASPGAAERHSPARVLLVSRLRVAVRDGGQVVHRDSTDVSQLPGTTLGRFLDEELPSAGLCAQLVWPIPGGGDLDAGFLMHEVVVSDGAAAGTAQAASLAEMEPPIECTESAAEANARIES